MAPTSKFEFKVPFTKIDGLCVHSHVITEEGLDFVRAFDFKAGDLLNVTYPKQVISKQTHSSLSSCISEMNPTYCNVRLVYSFRSSLVSNYFALD